MDNANFRIWVGCLAAYNNGTLHGEWIDLDGKDEDQVQEDIQAILKSSPIPNAEEWHICDSEGFGKFEVKRHHDIEELVKVVSLIEEHGEPFKALLSYHNDVDYAEKVMGDGYRGEYESTADYAQELTEECSEIPEHLAPYIDWERMARDMEINDILAIEVGYKTVYIFDKNI